MALPRSYSFDNGTTLAAGFTQQYGSSPVIEFGGVGYSGTGQAAAFDSSNSYNDDHWSEVTLDSTVNQMGPTVRASGVDGAADYYWADVFSGQYLILYKILNGGSPSQIGATFDGGAADYFQADQVIRLTATGTTLTVARNGSTIKTETDSAIASGSAGFAAGIGNMRAWQGDNAGAAPGGGELLLFVAKDMDGLTDMKDMRG